MFTNCSPFTEDCLALNSHLHHEKDGFVKSLVDQQRLIEQLSSNVHILFTIY